MPDPTLNARPAARPRRLRAAHVLALVCLLVPASAAAQRASGIQLTPDSRQYLINKDVPPNQRWAITWNLNDDTITGNVFFLDGSQPPQFIWCEQVSERPSPNPAQSEFDFRCFGAGPCEQAPCSSAAFVEIATVTLNGAFLFPPGTTSTLSGNVQPIFTATCASSDACHADGRPPDLLPGRTWAATFEVPSIQDPAKLFIAPFDPEGSYVLDKILGIQSSGARMPLGATPLDAAQTEAVRAWIREGAANN